MRRIISVVLLVLLAGCTASPSPAPPQPKQFDIFFTVGSAKLTPDGQQVVDAIAAAARDSKPSSITVEGEADGTSPRDAQLADQRATVVTTALKASGVDPAKIAQHAALALPAQTDLTTHVATHKVTVQLLP
ncbi:MAG TPA: OmpA family protein [Stellaceae bacterium]|nr:OmpA family protein [Stellaceae bacterium]